MRCSYVAVLKPYLYNLCAVALCAETVLFLNHIYIICALLLFCVTVLKPYLYNLGDTVLTVETMALLKPYLYNVCSVGKPMCVGDTVLFKRYLIQCVFCWSVCSVGQC